MENLSVQHLLATLRQTEAPLHTFVQQNFRFAEPLWLSFSELLGAAQLLDVWVPWCGTFSHPLLVRLVCSLGVVNTFVSLVKWCLPAHRPYWWASEFGNSNSLQQYPATCETSGGFPSGHATSFTTFVFLSIVFLLKHLNCRWGLQQHYMAPIRLVVVAGTSVVMWASRLYLGAEFLHQCVLGSALAVVLLHFFDSHTTTLYTLSRWRSVFWTSCFGLVPVVVYYAMLHADMDPHWSVRMAFKWCVDPSYLRHETSPIFALSRDFGYLMGVALSAPVYKRYESSSSVVKRASCIFVIEVLNFLGRQQTPKQRGRLVFVLYEFVRNLMHSYTLLSILPKLTL